MFPDRLSLVRIGAAVNGRGHRRKFRPIMARDVGSVDRTRLPRGCVSWLSLTRGPYIRLILPRPHICVALERVAHGVEGIPRFVRPEN